MIDNKFKEEKLIVEEAFHGVRIDKFVSEIKKDLSRSYIQKLIQDGYILVDDMNVKSNYKIQTNQNISMKIPSITAPQIKPENIKINVIYEDDDLIIINKDKGMVVHPGAANYSGTLVNALLYHYPNQLSNINAEERPGIVHRLDQDTTGILLVCKNNDAHEFIAHQFANGTVTRKYLAIVHKHFSEESGRVDAPIGRHPKERVKMAINYQNGKTAITNYKLIENLKNNYSYIECSLETGRTHQIRVHLASIKHPILGDAVYGSNKKIPYKLNSQALHAYACGFIHPKTKEYLEFTAPLPEYFQQLLEQLRF